MISREFYTLTVNFDGVGEVLIEDTLAEISRAISEGNFSGEACGTTWDIESEEIELDK